VYSQRKQFYLGAFAGNRGSVLLRRIMLL